MNSSPSTDVAIKSVCVFDKLAFGNQEGASLIVGIFKWLLLLSNSTFVSMNSWRSFLRSLIKSLSFRPSIDDRIESTLSFLMTFIWFSL